MERQQDKQNLSSRLPGGMTVKEAVFLLGVFARLKEKQSGRLAVTVSDGRVVDIELVERLDQESLAVTSKPG